jgi:hypothetical protein
VFKSIDVNGYRSTGQAQYWDERAISCIADQDSIKLAEHSVHSRQECVDDGIEIFVTDGRKDF